MPPLKPTLFFLFLLTGNVCFSQCLDVNNESKNTGYVFLNGVTGVLQTDSLIGFDSVLSTASQKKFTPLSNEKVLQKGYDPHYFWYRFSLCNRDTLSSEFVLLLGGLGIRKAVVWQGAEAQWKMVGQTGYQYRFADRPYPFVHQALPLLLPPRTTQTFYLQLDESHAFKSTAFVLVKAHKMKLIEHRFYFVFGLIAGTMLLFFVFNVYLFFSIKERIHFWYALYIVTILFFLLKNEGLDAEFLGLDSSAGYRSTYMAAVADLSIGFLMQVVLLFLTNLKKDGWTFRLLQFMKWMLFSLAFIEWLTFLLQPQTSVEATVFAVARNLGTLSLVTIMLACAYSFYKGFKPALFLLGAQAIFLAGGISRALFLETDSVIFPPSLFEIGLLVEVVVISYGLMFRYNRYKREKDLLAAQLEGQQAQAARQMVLVQEAEQKRIAEDLHDEIGGNLAALKMTMQSFALGDAQLQTLSALVDQVTANARQIAHNLMPPEFENTGLEELLKNYFERLNKDANLRFRFYSSGESNRFSKADELILYRIVMEISSNVIKHAKATEATVQLVYHEEQLALTAEDNGTGINPAAAGGNGLKNIRSRVQYLGGQIAIDTGAHGTTIIIHLPYKK